MAKRKRGVEGENMSSNGAHGQISKIPRLETHLASSNVSLPTILQIIVGSYEKVLHGVTATIFQSTSDVSKTELGVDFADTFLFNAHGSAIRCLALSPPSSSDPSQNQKIILASGSTDERINLYHISTSPPPLESDKGPLIPTLAGNRIKENPRNRELGSLLHHSSTISALYFPTRSKLLSAAEDNTLAFTRTRDWTVLSTIKAPTPKAHGRPSGDTAPPGLAPAGVNDFAVHPSMKLMVSVGKGEKCMRLWNLVTGKKAGVLNFEKELLRSIGEGKWGSGEGRKVEWNSDGEEFVVGFERGAVVFGMDSKPKCRILPSPSTKIHQMHFVALNEKKHETSRVLALSTENGQILFYPTADVSKVPDLKNAVPACKPIGQMGGTTEGLKSRIKDFEILKAPSLDGSDVSLFIITGSSGGTIHVWTLDEAELLAKTHQSTESGSKEPGHSPNVNGSDTGHQAAESKKVRKIGRLLGIYETSNRITCLKAFIMSSQSDMRDTVHQDGADQSSDQSTVTAEESEGDASSS